MSRVTLSSAEVRGAKRSEREGENGGEKWTGKTVTLARRKNKK